MNLDPNPQLIPPLHYAMVAIFIHYIVISAWVSHIEFILYPYSLVLPWSCMYMWWHYWAYHCRSQAQNHCRSQAQNHCLHALHQWLKRLKFINENHFRSLLVAFLMCLPILSRCKEVPMKLKYSSAFFTPPPLRDQSVAEILKAIGQFTFIFVLNYLHDCTSLQVMWLRGSTTLSHWVQLFMFRCSYCTAVCFQSCSRQLKGRNYMNIE